LVEEPFARAWLHDEEVAGCVEDGVKQFEIHVLVMLEHDQHKRTNIT
jgi:hypothetical protein